MQVRQKLDEVPLKSNNKLKKKGNLAAEYDKATWHQLVSQKSIDT